MNTIDWKSKEEAIALLIGHDPRLQNSNTVAEFALFSDYYFKTMSANGAEKRKYGLAKATFEHILYITNGQIKPEQVYVTNLCNDSLPHAPKGKTVYINESKALEGIDNIKKILQDNPSIKYIFPLSLQVNYWLQKLNFYNSKSDFVENSKPKEKGINNSEPYYEPLTPRTFLTICGNQYKINHGHHIVIPILHSKNFPLKSRFIAYSICYDKIRQFFRNIKCT